MGLSSTPHFKPAEFACKDGTQYPERWALRLTRLMMLCEALRAEASRRAGRDMPVDIVSAYRSDEYNRELIKQDAAKGLHGVASGSRHVLGQAVDMRIKGMKPNDVYDMGLEMYEAGKLPDLGGIGIYPGWVHFDIRDRIPAGHLAMWGKRNS